MDILYAVLSGLAILALCALIFFLVSWDSSKSGWTPEDEKKMEAFRKEAIKREAREQMEEQKEVEEKE